MADERIAELFPEPQLASYVRGMRESFYLGDQGWKYKQIESSKGQSGRYLGATFKLDALIADGEDLLKHGSDGVFP